MPLVTVTVMATVDDIVERLTKRSGRVGRALGVVVDLESEPAQDRFAKRGQSGHSFMGQLNGDPAASIACMKFDSYFWARAVLVLAIIGDFGAALIRSPIGGYLLIVDGIGVLVAGVSVFRDIGGAGTGFAQAYLKMSPSWYLKTWPNNSRSNLYRWTGIVVSALAVVTITIGVAIARRPA